MESFLLTYFLPSFYNTDKKDCFSAISLNKQHGTNADISALCSHNAQPDKSNIDSPIIRSKCSLQLYDRTVFAVEGFSF